VRFALGAAFLRAVRFVFLRSSLLSDFVFAIEFQSEWDVVGIAITIVMAIHAGYGSEMNIRTMMPATIIPSPTHISTRPICNVLAV
jgi:hypothetical protein